MVSVFVNNINPVVDQAGLWGIFKPFGRIRDIFLSPKSNTRRCCYAFIRFGTLEEASKVASMVDGMHVYGWTISVKVAEYGWDKRRSTLLVRRWDGNREERQNHEEARQRYRDRGVDPRAGATYHNRGVQSYAEVIKEDRKRGNDSKLEKKVLEWKIQSGEKEWLGRIAIGIMKDFSNLCMTNAKLEDRGFVFSSTFL